MRLTSRRPCESNRHNSTFSALAENRAKFVPRPSHVAPRGCGAPAEMPLLDLGNQENRRERRDDKTDLGNRPCVQRVDRSAVPHAAAAVDGRIGIENLAPGADERYLDAIIAGHLGRESDDDKTARPRLLALAHPGKDAVIRVIADHPFESGILAVELMQCRQRAIETS